MARPTATEVRALAGDAVSFAAGQRLALPGPWSALGHNERAVWGACRGSARVPYQVAVDGAAPVAFRCECPSRKFPCKHALGLLLLWAAHSDAIPHVSPPGDVAAWLATRSPAFLATTTDRDEPQAPLLAVAAEVGSPSGSTDEGRSETRPPPDPSAAAARVQRRTGRIVAGMAELDRWLGDLVRGGLAHAPAQPYTYWDAMASRLVDAQAPGAASAVRRMAAVAGSGEGWPDRLLAQCCRLHLLAAGWARFDQLSESERADLRTAAGWPWPSEQVASRPRERDRWYVLARSETEEERVTALRTWLWGLEGGRLALVLDFARPGAVPAWELWPGQVVDAEVARYPGSAQLRVVIARRWDDPAEGQAAPTAPPGWADLGAVAEARGAALARDPWMERWPVSVAGVVPVRADGAWELTDAGGRSVPLRVDDRTGWRLLAVAAGRTVHLLAEWVGTHFLPLGVWVEDRMVVL